MSGIHTQTHTHIHTFWALALLRKGFTQEGITGSCNIKHPVVFFPLQAYNFHLEQKKTLGYLCPPLLLFLYFPIPYPTVIPLLWSLYLDNMKTEKTPAIVALILAFATETYFKPFGWLSVSPDLTFPKIGWNHLSTPLPSQPLQENTVPVHLFKKPFILRWL